MIDKIDTPSALKADWSWLKTLFGYIIVFFAGYLSALSGKWTKKKKHKEYHPWVEKIQSTKTSKELLQLLMAKDSKAFTSCIEKLEASIYGNENIHLGSIKKEVLERIKYA
jgi:Mg2+ and Co2+ transporter CorA